MKFILDLIRWFIKGEPHRIEEPELEIAAPVRIEPIPTKKNEGFDIVKESDPKAFLLDLQSLRSFTKNFDRAREELLQELQRLAPPRRSRSGRKDAA